VVTDVKLSLRNCCHDVRVVVLVACPYEDRAATIPIEVAPTTATPIATAAMTNLLMLLGPMLRSIGIQIVYEQRRAERRPIRIERVGHE
jgi:hypothetical protein